MRERPSFCCRLRKCLFVASMALLTSGAMAAEYDLIIRNGTVYDGSGNAPLVEDVAFQGDAIAAIGHLETTRAQREIDARGLAVAPGFINMLSWANESLIQDGRSQSDIRQGVTLEVMGEGWSMGPWTDEMKRLELSRQDDIHYPTTWPTLGHHPAHPEPRGIAPNLASFVG